MHIRPIITLLTLCLPATSFASSVANFTQINSGDTAWMLISSILVMLMILPGLALFYAGMVRKKNVLASFIQAFALSAIVCILWVTIGYSLVFSEGSSIIGGFNQFGLSHLIFDKANQQISVHPLAPTIPEVLFVLFQMTFAMITPVLITGAFAERIKFSALLIFMTLWTCLVYFPVAHWVWGPSGWMMDLGVLDFAGGTVVHINAGITGLVAALVVGKRLGYGRDPMPPHNLVLTLVGTAFLWVGWFGFNAGSAVAADGRAAMAMLTTQVAASIAALSWMAVEWIHKGHPSGLGIASGVIAGLVAITPAAGFVDVTGALIIGALSGIACYYTATILKHKLAYDDSLDAFGVHGVGGILGALLTGPLAIEAIGGVSGSLGVQAIGVGVTCVYTAIVSWILLKLIDKLMGLRVSSDEEREGLDLSSHNERVE